MPKPEPTWTQKAQQCQEQVDLLQVRLERYNGIELELEQAKQRLSTMEKSAVDVSGLHRQIEFWRREAQTAQQREAEVRVRVQQLEKALREAPTRDWVETISTKLGETELERQRAAQQAAECTRRAAGMVQRLQQFQSATEALGAMEQAADQWQRKHTVLAQENSELRQQAAVVPALERKLSQVTEERDNLRLRDERHSEMLRSYEAEVRRLTPLQNDLVQATEALEKARRETKQARQERDQVQVDREELATLRRSSGHQTQRLFEAAAELERKQRELAVLNAEVRRLTTKLNDARTNLG